ncbi:putative ENTH/ANTH/VHS superfamily protein [Quillaja saponaria]|uniref:ENTH/ANTH/VHS superfamily protein n=1 Tax=Quillaja saponaria TaxID=32244 RepID=A0AAD7LJ58_QUISA|nr:putative ENTH/ANTH/VHS superfamily protein [Quillaja saponaria]
MAAHSKQLRNLIHIFKDKASLIIATLSIKRHVSSVHLPILRATTHNLSNPPSESRIAAVLSLGHGSHLIACACINAIMERLHQTHSATVALKCLFTIHNIINRGSFILRDQLSYYPSHGGHNFLNLSTFRDNCDSEMWELSSWVRWYAAILEQSLTVSRVLNYYIRSSSFGCSKKVKEEKILVLSNFDLLCEIDGLVGYVEQISRVPDSLYLQRIGLVFEVVRLVAEDYRWVQSEIFQRVAELGDRIENMVLGELTQLHSNLKRLEECKEGLVLLLVNRKRNYGFWDLMNQTKRKVVMMKEDKEGKRLLLTMGKRDESRESTRFGNPFLEPEGQLLPVPYGVGWFGRDLFSLTSTVG